MKSVEAQTTLSWASGNVNDPNDGKEYEPFAKEALKALAKHYPGYSWHIQIGGGIMMVKNFTLDWRGRWGMVLELQDMMADHARLVRATVMAAGEFLERARVRRGGKPDGFIATSLEGAGKKWAKAPFGPTH
jgi:hypothetical protein